MSCPAALPIHRPNAAPRSPPCSPAGWRARGGAGRAPVWAPKVGGGGGGGRMRARDSEGPPSPLPSGRATPKGPRPGGLPRARPARPRACPPPQRPAWEHGLAAGADPGGPVGGARSRAGNGSLLAWREKPPPARVRALPSLASLAPSPNLTPPPSPPSAQPPTPSHPPHSSTMVAKKVRGDRGRASGRRRAESGSGGERAHTLCCCLPPQSRGAVFFCSRLLREDAHAGLLLGSRAATLALSQPRCRPRGDLAYHPLHPPRGWDGRRMGGFGQPRAGPHADIPSVVIFFSARSRERPPCFWSRGRASGLGSPPRLSSPAGRVGSLSSQPLRGRWALAEGGAGWSAAGSWRAEKSPAPPPPPPARAERTQTERTQTAPTKMRQPLSPFTSFTHSLTHSSFSLSPPLALSSPSSRRSRRRSSRPRSPPPRR